MAAMERWEVDSVAADVSPQEEARAAIAKEVAKSSTTQALVGSLNARMDELPPETHKYIASYVTVISTADGVRDAAVEVLASGVGGQFDGGIAMAKTTMVGHKGESFEITTDRIEEVGEHEAYHRNNNHLQSFKTYAGAGAPVIIGGQEFTQEDVVEGTTVHFTGDTFVSADYVQKKQKIEQAALSSGRSMDAIASALRDGDLTKIDDREHQQDASYAVSA